MSTGLPTTTSSTSDRSRWQSCFATAIEYYHSKIDEQILIAEPEQDSSNQPETAREYFEGRGWSEKTIDEHALGWAPAENNLRHHLKRAGFSDEEMLKTGLFTKNLHPLWNGRYVFPYHVEHGNPVYAIARETNGNQPADFLRGKYAKAACSKDYTEVSEPIFGLKTIEEGFPVVITEGVADAITVQQAGFPCISPVTRKFKKNDQPKLLANLLDHNVSRVYVVQDAEPPSIKPNQEGDGLVISQYEPGIKGAVETASFLSENGFESRVNTPPQIGSNKIDLHDFIHEGWGTIESLIRSAKPADHYPCHSTIRSQKTAIGSSTQTHTSPNSGNQSAIFSLDMCQVTGLSEGYRGVNPLGHTGDSENYFKIHNREWTFDHKRDVGYNPLLYLLCEAGERSADNPYGSLSDRERFVAWKHAKENGVVAEDDPIPHDGLVYIATYEKGFCSEADIFDGRKIPPKAYNQALNVVRNEYDLDPGREPIGGGFQDNKTHSSTVADQVQPDSLPDLTLDEVQRRCYQTIEAAIADEKEYQLVDALPAQGKSFGVVKWAAENETPISVLTPRRDLHKQNKDWCNEHGLEFYSLPAFHRDCGCANGDHGAEWQERVLSLYNVGATGKQIHQMAEIKFDQELPCMEKGTCPYHSKMDFDPEEFDVLLGNYRHGNMDQVTDDRVVVIDESPSSAFHEKYAHDDVVRIVSYFLGKHDEIPFDNYTDLTENRSDPYQSHDAKKWFDENYPDLTPDSCEVMTSRNTEVHAKAPLLTYALLVGEELGNGWEQAILGDERFAARNRNPIPENDFLELVLLLPPSFDGAQTVIGLDGTPCVEQWELCLGISVEHRRVLNDTERASYIKNVLNQQIFQMSETSKPYSGGGSINLPDDKALINQVGERERQRPDLITSRKAIDRYRTDGVLSLVGEHKYYGNMTGSNDFGHSRLGLVIGSPHYGDDYLEMWGAFTGECVKRIGNSNGMNVDFGSFGNKLLEEMREGEVIQSIMRFGRDGDGATIFVSTGAIPDWVPLAGKGGIKRWSKGTKLVLNAIKSRREWKTRDLLTEVKERKGKVLDTDESELISERQVKRNLDTLVEYEFITRHTEGNGIVWEDCCLEDVPADRYVFYEK